MRITFKKVPNLFVHCCDTGWVVKREDLCTADTLTASTARIPITLLNACCKPNLVNTPEHNPEQKFPHHSLPCTVNIHALMLLLVATMHLKYRLFRYVTSLLELN